MSLFSSLFPKNGTVQNGGTAPQPTVPAPQNKGMDQNNPGANPTVIPPNGGSNNPAEPISPLDNFKEIWKTAGSDGKQPVDPFAQPLLNNDPAKFAEAAGKLNFTQNIPPELFTKALAGDPQALADAINKAAQTAFMAAGTLTTQTVEGATKTNNQRVDSVLEDRFKAFLVKQQKSENPVLNHPSAAPMLDLAKRQLMQQHPDKSPAEIHAMAEGFLGDFASSFVGEKTKQTQRTTAPDPHDFSHWDA